MGIDVTLSIHAYVTLFLKLYSQSQVTIHLHRSVPFPLPVSNKYFDIIFLLTVNTNTSHIVLVVWIFALY